MKQIPTLQQFQETERTVDSRGLRRGRQDGAKERPGKDRQGDATLLGEKSSVSFKTAEQYLGITERHRQNLIKSGALKVDGLGQNRKITTESLKNYLPLESPK